MMLACSVLGYGAPVVLYDNHTPNNLIAMATGVSPAGLEIETADDFILASTSQITAGSFAGMIVNGTASNITAVDVEFYRVFPLDSTSPASGHVPTRTNSPSDTAFATRAGGDLTYSLTTLSASFTAANSVQPGGIHPLPNTVTGGNGPLTGTEVQFNFTLNAPVTLGPDHYFFVPQVQLSNGGTFYWLSASRPISGAGTTPILPDLQVWTRDANLEPDWLRVGTDIIGGNPAPTFNAAFSLSGTVEPASPVPEGGTTFTLLGLTLACLGAIRRRFRPAA